MRTSVELDKVRALVEGRHENPFDILGPHEVDRIRPPGDGGAGLSARTRSRRGSSIRPTAASQPMRRIHPAGLFEAICPAHDDTCKFTNTCSACVDQRGEQSTMHDPYAFPPLLTDYDLHLLGRRPALAVLPQAGRPSCARSTASTA